MPASRPSRASWTCCGDPVNGGFTLETVTVRHASIAALAGVSVQVAPGEAVALVGPSGAGKTTLLRLLNGGLRPAAGRVLAGDRDLTTLSPGALRRLRSRIAFVHQDLRLVPSLRASQNVLAGGFGRQNFVGAVRAMLWPRPADLARAYALLERVGVGDRLFERVDRLSGGQQQRVALARALYQDPRAVLADEPVASVDPARARDVVALLRDVCAEHGLTLVMSLHNLDLAQEFFPRLIGLRDGRVHFDGAPRDLGPRAYRALYRLPGGEVDDGRT